MHEWGLINDGNAIGTSQGFYFIHNLIWEDGTPAIQPHFINDSIYWIGSFNINNRSSILNGVLPYKRHQTQNNFVINNNIIDLCVYGNHGNLIQNNEMPLFKVWYKNKEYDVIYNSNNSPRFRNNLLCFIEQMVILGTKPPQLTQPHYWE